MRVALPSGLSFARAIPDCGKQTLGVYLCTQVLNNRCGLLCPAGGADYENYENYENYEICCWCAVCIALPCGNSARCITQRSFFRPSQETLRKSKPTGYHMTPLSCPYCPSGPLGPSASVTPPRPALPRQYQKKLKSFKIQNFLKKVKKNQLPLLQIGKI